MSDDGLIDPRRHFEMPLAIGVISDTHVFAASRRQVPESVHAVFRRARVGLILHLGDANIRQVIEDLAEIAPVLAVSGNNDDDDLHEMLPGVIEFSVGPYTFGMVHGDGGRSARQVVTETFGGKLDLACFGHSHIPYIGEANHTTLFNPGSATDRRWHEHFGVGIIRVAKGGIDPELILFSHAGHLDNVEFPEMEEDRDSEENE